MASASITTRHTMGGGRRYAVRFRRGGRYFPVEHGGTFGTLMVVLRTLLRQATTLRTDMDGVI